MWRGALLASVAIVCTGCVRSQVLDARSSVHLSPPPPPTPCMAPPHPLPTLSALPRPILPRPVAPVAAVCPDPPVCPAPIAPAPTLCTCVPVTCPALPAEPPPTSRLSTLLWLVFGALIGTVFSIYATVVFDRYKQFTDLRGRLEGLRILFRGYPQSARQADLERALQHIEALYFQLERIEHQMRVGGHFRAASRVLTFANFIRNAGLCIGRMLDERTGAMPLDQYLSWYSTDFSEYWASFVDLAETLKPNVVALLQPWPRPAKPRKSIVAAHEIYFDKLLNPGSSRSSP